MNPPSNTNPILRLRSILNEAAAAETKGNKPDTVKEIWGKVLGLELEYDNEGKHAGTVEVIAFLGELKKLFEEVIEILERAPGINQELYVKPIRYMSGLVSNFNILDQPWSDYSHYLSPADRVALDYIVDYSSDLMVAYSEKEISSDEIAEILRDTNSLYESILNSDLPRQVRTILVDIVEKLRQALHLYRVHGAKALKNAMGESAGILFANKELIEQNKDNDQIVAIAALMRKVDVAYQVGTTAKTIFETVTLMLPLLGTGK